MKKSKISLSRLKLSKQTILNLNANHILGGDLSSVGPNCNPQSNPPNCALSRVCPTNDMADPKCFNNDTVKDSCTCPVQSTPLYTC